MRDDADGADRSLYPMASEYWTALLAGVVGIAGSFALAGPTTDFIAVPVTDAVVTSTPGIVTTVAIQSLGRWSEGLALGTAVVLSVALLAGATLVGARVGRRLDPVAGPLLGTYFVAWAAGAAVLRAPFPAVAAAVPPAVVVWLRRRTGRETTGRSTRRALIQAVGALGVVGLSGVLGLHRASVDASPLSAIPSTERNTIDRRLADAADRSLTVEGIPGLVSEVDQFYEVDIDPVNPDVNVTDWSLSITGAVDRELTLDYGTLTDRRFEHRFVTLRCVGEPLNGHEMDTALWTGVSVEPLLAEAGARGDCACVMLRAADGYYEEFPLAALRPGFLAFGMNGQLLPRKHGFPVRALVPGHWGEVNVKWLTEIELLEREADGFWELRGWHGTGPVGTVAKLHAQNRLPDGRIQVGGHAYAGHRGVSRVEVSVDGGETWAEARLSAPLPAADVWRQWAYEWEPTAEAHEVVVRAVEADGTIQAREPSPAYPDGARGWVSTVVRP